MWVSHITMGIALALLALTIFSYVVMVPEADDEEGEIRKDVLIIIALCLAASYICHLKGW
jgi:membrane-bound metal-dependent hydrolase YbcI (DUF457 family)